MENSIILKPDTVEGRVEKEATLDQYIQGSKGELFIKTMESLMDEEWDKIEAANRWIDRTHYSLDAHFFIQHEGSVFVPLHNKSLWPKKDVVSKLEREIIISEERAYKFLESYMADHKWVNIYQGYAVVDNALIKSLFYVVHKRVISPKKEMLVDVAINPKMNALGIKSLCYVGVRMLQEDFKDSLLSKTDPIECYVKRRIEFPGLKRVAS